MERVKVSVFEGEFTAMANVYRIQTGGRGCS